MISLPGIVRSWKPRDYVAVARALRTQVRIEWGIRRRTLTEVARSLDVPLVTSTATAATEPFTARLSAQERRSLRAVRRVLRRWPWGATCLRRALATGHVLRHRRPSLRVGVAK